MFNFLELIRFKTWKNGLIASLAFAILLTLLTSPNFNQFFFISFFIIYQFFVFSMGFLINSFSEKEHVFQGISEKNAFFVLVIISLIVAFSPFFFGFKTGVLGLLCFLFGFFYSSKPIRFKEKMILGPITVGLSTYFFPFLIFAVLIKNLELGFYFALILFMRQVICELLHQISHYKDDLKNNSQTWVVSIGIEKAIFYSKLISIFYLILLGSIFFIGVGEALLIFIIFLFFSILTLLRVFNL